MTTTTRVATTRPFRMAVGARLATIGFAIFHHSIAQVHNAQAIWARTFHLSHRSHGYSPNNAALILIHEQ